MTKQQATAIPQRVSAVDHMELSNVAERNRTGNPMFDDNDIPNYSNSLSRRINSRQQTRLNTAKYKLWPIPQGEIDKDPKLTQNVGWQ